LPLKGKNRCRRTRADPWAIAQRLNESGDWQELARTVLLKPPALELSAGLLTKIGEQRERITRDLIAIARKAFDVPAFGEDASGELTGLGDWEVIVVLSVYIEFANRLRNEVLPLLKPWKPSEEVPSTASTDSTTAPSAESSSTPSGSPAPESANMPPA
jgi:hypothetical protein